MKASALKGNLRPVWASNRLIRLVSSNVAFKICLPCATLTVLSGFTPSKVCTVRQDKPW